MLWCLEAFFWCVLTSGLDGDGAYLHLRSLSGSELFPNSSSWILQILDPGFSVNMTRSQWTEHKIIWVSKALNFLQTHLKFHIHEGCNRLFDKSHHQEKNRQMICMQAWAKGALVRCYTLLYILYIYGFITLVLFSSFRWIWHSWKNS